MAASANFALKAVRGSGGVVYSLSLLIRWAQRARCQAETPLIALRRFPEPALKELDATLSVDIDLFAECRSFAQAFRLARQTIGAEIESEDQMLIEAEPEDE
jgi:hypothetical protein